MFAGRDRQQSKGFGALAEDGAGPRGEVLHGGDAGDRLDLDVGHPLAHGVGEVGERAVDVGVADGRERDGAGVGCDGVSDYRPHDIEGVRLPIHTLTLAAMGMQLLDNQNLEQLAEACASRRRWEFLLTIAPLRLVRYGKCP